MSGSELFVLILTGLVLLLTLFNILRPDVIGILALLALGGAGILTPDAALSGFSSSVTITLIGLFIISEGLEQTGVVQRLGEAMVRLGGHSERSMVLVVMTASALVSLIMNNVAAAAMLLPAVLAAARQADIKPSRLMIPLAFGTLVGGMATYFTTANIIMSDQLQLQGYAGLTMLDFVPTGGLIAVVAIGFTALIGYRLLPLRETIGAHMSGLSDPRRLFETYQLDERLWELHVPAGTPLVGRMIRDSRIGSELGLTVMAIWRGQQAILIPEPDETIQADDLLLILGREDRVEGLLAQGLELGRPHETEIARLAQRAHAVALTEVVIPPRSSAIGQTLSDLRFRARYGLTGVALWREGRSYRTDVGKFPLQVGDALLMVGRPRSIEALAADRDFIVTTSDHRALPPRPQFAPRAILITLAVLLVAIFEIVPIAEAMLLGGILMVLSGCLSMDEAYRAIEWRTIFQIAGMTAVSIALIQTGIAGRVSAAVVELTAPFGPLVLIGGLFLLIMLLTQAIGGQSAALIAAPIAVAAAGQFGIHPQAMGVAAAIACSTAFLTITGHPVNVLVLGPGGYQPGDYLRPGAALTVITFGLTLLAMRFFWGVAA
jgi:di/tricarboxylate transporter